jgi:hypothetical protein
VTKYPVTCSYNTGNSGSTEAFVTQPSAYSVLGEHQEQGGELQQPKQPSLPSGGLAAGPSSGLAAGPSSGLAAGPTSGEVVGRLVKVNLDGPAELARNDSPCRKFVHRHSLQGIASLVQY